MTWHQALRAGLTCIAIGLVAGCGGSDSASPADDNGTATPAAAADAGNFQGDAGHSGIAPSATPVLPLQSAWQRTFAGAVSYPVIASGKVFVTVNAYVGAQSTQLIAIDQATGFDAWPAVTIGTSYSASHVHHQGRVIVLGSDGIVRAFDAQTGAAQWSTLLGAYGAQTLAAADGKVFVASGNAVNAIDVRTGAVVWSQSGTSQVMPSLGAGNVLLDTGCDTFALAEATGVEQWRIPTASCSGGQAATVVAANGKAYVRSFDFTTYKATLTVRDAQTGSLVGSTRLFGSAFPPPPAVSSDAAYLLNGGTLQRFDTALATVAWSFAGDGTLAAAPLVVGGVVFIGGASGRLYALDAASGTERWSVLVPDALLAPQDLSYSSFITGMAAADGVLAVPAGRTLTAWRLTPA